MDTVNDKSNEHLRLLTIFHYVVGVLSGLFACFPIIHLVIGIIAIVAPEKLADNSGSVPPPFFGWLFAIIGGGMVLGGWAYAILLIFAGKFLGQRQRYMFCFIMACISCIFIPFGTALGICTIIVLSRPQVKALFGYQAPVKEVSGQ